MRLKPSSQEVREEHQRSCHLSSHLSMQADYKIQTMLIRGIHSFFPSLKIVGEETTEYEGAIDLDPHSITLDNYPKEI